MEERQNDFQVPCCLLHIGFKHFGFLGWYMKLMDSKCLGFVKMEKLRCLFESDYREINLFTPKGNQPWIFTGRTDAETETPVLWPPDGMSHWKRPCSWETAAAAGKSRQSCPTLCDPIDGLPPGSPVPGILQGRILEWVTISFSNAWKWKVKVKSLQHIRLFATPWTAAHQTPPSMGFSKQEYWSGVPLPSLWLGKIKGKRRGWQRRRWLDSITNSLNMNLSKF